MAVRYNGPEGTREFKLRVRPGPEGLATFKAHLKEILGFDVGPEFDVTFECQMPATGSMLTLSGLNAYGAATHCAALLAATKASGAAAAHAGPAATAAATAAAATPPTDNHAVRTMSVSPPTPDPSSNPGALRQRRQMRTPPVLLPPEVPLAAAAPPPPPLQTAATAPVAVAAAAAPAASGRFRVGHCSSSSSSRRVCQTGYVTNTPIILQQQQQTLHDAAIARHTIARQYGNTASYGLYRAHGRPAGTPGVIRSLNAAAAASGRLGRRAFRTLSSDAAPVGISMRDVVGYDSLDDNLLPFGRRHAGALEAATRRDAAYLTEYAAAAAAAAGTRSSPAAHLAAEAAAEAAGEAAASDGQGVDAVEILEAEVDGVRVRGGSVEGRSATAPGGNLWMAGAVRFGGRVLPMSPSSSAPPYSGLAPTAPTAPTANTPISLPAAAPADSRRGGVYGGAAKVAAVAVAAMDAVVVSDDGDDGGGGSGSSVGGATSAAMASWSAFTMTSWSIRDAIVDSSLSHVAAAPALAPAAVKSGQSTRHCGGGLQLQLQTGGSGGSAVATVAAVAAAVGVRMGDGEEEEEGEGPVGVTSRGRRATRVRSALKRVAARTLASLARALNGGGRK